jgi:hypothetical protein
VKPDSASVHGNPNTPATHRPQTISIILSAVFCVIAICLQAWLQRDAMNEDGMSYADMAVQTAQGQIAALIHQYWSPLYPSLLAIAFRIFGAAPEHEFRLIHAVNAGIGLLSLGCFILLLREWSAMDRPSSHRSGWMSDSVRVVFAFVLFSWSALETAGIGMVSPDLLVNALIFAAAALACRIISGAGGTRTAAALGLLLGLAYLAKAALLPLAAVFLIVMWFARGRAETRPAVVVASIAMLLVSGPFIAILSSRAGRLTFGESGRLNYVWMVQKDVPRLFGWIGGTANAGAPVHPPRVLNERPKLFEYSDTVNGTYPPWYGPHYFNEGVRLHFDARKQLETVMVSLHDVYWAHQRNIVPLFAGLLFLFAVGKRPAIRQKALDQLWLMLWPVSAIALFSLVLMQPRYISAFLVLAWLWAYDAVTPQHLCRMHKIVLAVVSASIVTLVMYTQFIRSHPQLPDDLGRATALTRVGLRSGDHIAIVGAGFDAYYAHLARFKIVAEVRPPEEFWALTGPESTALMEKLRRSGVRAIVSPRDCPSGAGKQWHALDRSDVCVAIMQ